MTQLATALGLAGTVLLSFGYAVRVAFEHDRHVDDAHYPAGAVTGQRPDVPADLPTGPVVPLVPAARAPRAARLAERHLVAAL